MSADNFDTSLRLVLQDEGSNDDDPQDHGGRTSRGITQLEYDKYCMLNNLEGGDVWSATDAVIRSIYYDDYWQPRCDTLPLGLDYVFFDTTVNAGSKQATKELQRALSLTVDGVYGPRTKAAAEHADARVAIPAMSNYRRIFYRNLAQFPRFGKGWLRRVDHCESEALKMIKT